MIAELLDSAPVYDAKQLAREFVIEATSNLAIARQQEIVNAELIELQNERKAKREQVRRAWETRRARAAAQGKAQAAPDAAAAL